MKKMEIEQMECIQGGTSQAEYCGILGELLTGGGYQGDYGYGFSVYRKHCSGIPLWN